MKINISYYHSKEPIQKFKMVRIDRYSIYICTLTIFNFLEPIIDSFDLHFNFSPFFSPTVIFSLPPL